MDAVKERLRGLSPRMMAAVLERILGEVDGEIEGTRNGERLLELWREKCATLEVAFELGMELAAQVVGGPTAERPGLLVVYGGKVVRAAELDLPDLVVLRSGMDGRDWRAAVVDHIIEEKDR